MIRFDFLELGLYMPDYNGMTISSVNALIIDKAANYYRTLYGFYDCLDEDIFNHYNWNVDIVQRFVEIPNDALIIEPQYH